MRLTHSILAGQLWTSLVCADPSNKKLLWKRQRESLVPFNNSTISATQTPPPEIYSSSLSSFPSTFTSSTFSSDPSTSSEPSKPIQNPKNATDSSGSGKENPPPDDVKPIPFNQTIAASNSSCSCTVNALAGLDWWFPNNIFQAIATIATVDLNGTNAYSLGPVQTSINVDDQVLAAGVVYTLTQTYDDFFNTSVDAYIASTPPLPPAYSTAVITLSDVVPAPTGLFGPDEFASLFVDPPVPTFAVPGATGNDYVATQTTPLLYYTAIEVIHYPGSSGNAGNGSCPPAQTINQPLSDSMVFPFPTDPAEDGVLPLSALLSEATPTGSLDGGFLRALPSQLQNCVPGSWIAPRPTMIVVVEVTYEHSYDTFLVHHEVSDSGTLDGPGPTAASIEGNGGGSPPAPTGTTGGENGDGGGSGSESGSGSGAGGGSGGGNPGAFDFSAIVSAVVSANGGESPPTSPLSSVASNIAFGIGGTPQGESGNSGSGPVNGIGFGQVSAASGPAATPPPVVIGGQTFTANPDGAINVLGQTLSPGGSAIFVNGQTVSLSPSTSLIVNGITLTPPPAGATPAAGPTLSLFGTTFQAADGGPEFIIGGETLTPGGTIVFHDTTISLAPTPTAVFINGASQSVEVITQPPAITVDGTVISAVPGGAFIVGTQTLRPGQSIVASGTTLSLDPIGGYIVINGVTSALSGTGLPYLVLGGMTYPATALPTGAYLIAGNVLQPGDVITVSGSTISLAPGGTALVVNGVTQYLPGYAPLTIGSETFQGHAGTYVVDGTTLVAGGQPITVHGTTVSLLAGGTAVVINGKTSTLSGSMNTPAAVSAVASSAGANSSSGAPGTASPAATSKKNAASSVFSSSSALSVAVLLVAALLVG